MIIIWIIASILLIGVGWMAWELYRDIKKYTDEESEDDG